MNGSHGLYVKMRRALTRKAVLRSGGGMRDTFRKLQYYLFVVSVIAVILTALALLNAYYPFANISSYDLAQSGASTPLMLAGYLGMFLSVAFLPIPDYFLVPAYGYLSSAGVFDPYATFVVCVLAAVVPISYVPGRFVARPLLLKGVAFFGISERAIKEAEAWLEEHGHFSIFIATFIPFFYGVVSLAAGMLKMDAGKFLFASIAGYGLRFAVLEYIGYNSIFIFTPSFDYAQRYLLLLLLILSSLYVALYLMRFPRTARRNPST